MKVGRLIVVRDTSRTPRYRCRVCGDAVFYDDEMKAYESHVASCSDRNADELRQLSLRGRAPGLFDPHVAGDVEMKRWARQHRRALVDGALKL